MIKAYVVAVIKGNYALDISDLYKTLYQAERERDRIIEVNKSDNKIVILEADNWQEVQHAE